MPLRTDATSDITSWRDLITHSRDEVQHDGLNVNPQSLSDLVQIHGLNASWPAYFSGQVRQRHRPGWMSQQAINL
jgi:hypothetical protein